MGTRFLVRYERHKPVEFLRNLWKKDHDGSPSQPLVPRGNYPSIRNAQILPRRRARMERQQRNGSHQQPDRTHTHLTQSTNHPIHERQYRRHAVHVMSRPVHRNGVHGTDFGLSGSIVSDIEKLPKNGEFFMLGDSSSSLRIYAPSASMRLVQIL